MCMNDQGFVQDRKPEALPVMTFMKIRFIATIMSGLLFLLAPCSYAGGTSSDAEIYSTIHMASTFLYLSRDPALEEEALLGLESIHEIMRQQSKDDANLQALYENMLDIMAERLNGKEVTDYDCQDLVAARDEIAGTINLGNEGQCQLSSGECFTIVKSMWSKVLSSYTFKTTDPAGMGGHSFFLEGETTTDLRASIYRIEQFWNNPSLLSQTDYSAWSKLEFLKQSITSSNTGGAAPFLAMRYARTIYELESR